MSVRAVSTVAVAAPRLLVGQGTRLSQHLTLAGALGDESLGFLGGELGGVVGDVDSIFVVFGLGCFQFRFLYLFKLILLLSALDLTNLTILIVDLAREILVLTLFRLQRKTISR